MHTFLDNFQQDGKNSAQIASHKAELRREEKFTDQKSLDISSLQTYYLNIDSSSGFGRDGKGHMLFKQSAYFVEVLISLHNNVSKGLERKGKKLTRLMLHPIDKWNVRLGNALDMDLNIT